MQLSPLDALLVAAATWRVAHMTSREALPFRIMERIRTRYPLGGLWACIYCTSLWAAALMLLLWHTDARFVVYLFSISGIALMLSSYTGVNHAQ